MAKAKYRFKKEFADAKIAIAGQRELITKENLTDELGDLIMKQPHLSHNIELTEEPEEKKTSKKKEDNENA
ncbi:MAG TPA: hypothetical protein VD794_02270 [Flavisolibacter sp.]|nr:hypothetical protein [Flavisolibacter sp.]